MEFATVFDDPWSKKPIPLGDAAIQHLELIEIFLKVITHLGDDNGYISDETLAYSEWRYIVYVQMIDLRGHSPSDILPPCSKSRWTTPTDKKAPGKSKNKESRVVIMHDWLRCRTAVPEQGFKVWGIEEYTAIRTQRVEERCRNQSQHEQFNATCGLRPWPALQDLRTELEQQISFWKVMVHAKNTLSGFADTLNEHTKDYKNYMGLVGHVLWRKGRYGRYESKHDPNNQPVSRSDYRSSLAHPPTLPGTLLAVLLRASELDSGTRAYVWRRSG
ncbi:hypothetical protein HYE68_008813 [Fusarium pseudograminearum]|nr:hypothetical protein HYE68_008813 [Fusarium pseudograminearum]